MYPTAAITPIQGGDPCIPRLDDRNVEIQESEVGMETRVSPEKTKDTSQIAKTTSIRNDKWIFRFALRGVNPWMQLARILVAYLDKREKVKKLIDSCVRQMYLRRK